MDNILKQNLIKEIGLDTLPQEEQESALLSIGRIIFQGVLIKVLDELNDKDKDELEKLLAEKSDDEAAILNFLRAKVANLEEIIKSEVERFKKESVDFTKSV
ncbi:MAG: hypothetical protein AAB596_01690 [Patescibacteria group bacterium]